VETATPGWALRYPAQHEADNFSVGRLGPEQVGDAPLPATARRDRPPRRVTGGAYMDAHRRQRALRRSARLHAQLARRLEAQRNGCAGTATKRGRCSLLTSKRTVFVAPSTHGVWSVIRFLRQSLELSPLGGSLMPQNRLRAPPSRRISAAVSVTFARVSSWGWTPAAGRCYLLSSSPRRRRQHVRRVVWRLVSGKRRVWRSVSLERRHGGAGPVRGSSRLLGRRQGVSTRRGPLSRLREW
jgi:hypothetical protein